MQPTRFVPFAVPFVAILSSSLLALACGGKTVSPSEELDATRAAQQRAKEAAEGRPAPSTSSDTGPATPACRYEGSGGGSSGGGPGYAQCMISDAFTCSGADRTITCECTTRNGGPWGEGKCTCGSLTFATDCANACSIRDEDYARCGLPIPKDEPSGGGGFSSSGVGGSSSSSGGSSSGSSGSSTSSSGG